MIAAPATDALLLDRSHREWRLVSEQPCNLLIEGTVPATDAVLHLLQPHIHEPIVWHKPTAPLELPSGETRTLMLTDAAALSGVDQQRLLAWIDDTGSRTRIVSTSPRSLFSLVEAGCFDAALYYRLNVLLVRVPPPVSAPIAV
jgi:hypothetical protein